MDNERLAVIENIRIALAAGDTFRKVELHDPEPSDEDIKRVIIPFDNLRKKPKNKLLSFFARKIAERETKARNTLTEIVGLENAIDVKGGAIVTSNHFSIMDNTIIRLLAMKCKRADKFDIVVQESNIFMEGFFGFLMKNCNTLPVSKSPSYMAKNLKPAIEALLRRGDFILVYPEQEMWFNYKKPRALRDGAYYYAAEFGVPIIPCFVEMQNLEEVEENGFLKVKHILHVMPPIYPDKALPKREAAQKMKQADMQAKLDCYERVYGELPSEDFLPERDIAGYVR